MSETSPAHVTVSPRFEIFQGNCGFLPSMRGGGGGGGGVWGGVMCRQGLQYG